MGDDSSLHNRVADASRKQFPGVRIVESQPDMVVFFTIVDYVPGCLPNCKKFRTYRNWSCEVEHRLSGCFTEMGKSFASTLKGEQR